VLVSPAFKTLPEPLPEPVHKQRCAAAMPMHKEIHTCGTIYIYIYIVLITMITTIITITII
jgi:hypothetical protein